MKSILALVIASALAACTSGGTPTPPSSAQPSASGSLTCERAMELAALELTETVSGDFTNADPAIAACDTFEEFAAASALYPHALDGFDPRSIAQDRCERADELAGEPLCEEVGPLPCDPGFVCNSALLPGEYTSTSTGAVITFTLTGEGWSGREDSPGDVPGGGDGFALYNDAAAPREVGGGISVVPYTGEVYALVCSPDTAGTAAMDFITFLSGRDGIQAEEPVDTQVGGQPAVRLDLTTDSPCNDPEVGTRMWMWILPSGGDFHFDDDARARVYAVDAGCVTLAIVTEGYPGLGADYDVLLAKAEEVIATMTIQPTC